MQCTPSMARMMLGDPAARASLSQLDMLLIGGEAFPRDLVQEVHAVAPDVHMLNMYGPTETTIWSTCHDLADAAVPDQSSVPIGRPIANTELLVLDEAGKFLPHGVIGELYIGGAGVTRGYLDRPELTAERFVEGSGAFDPASRWYKTGDLVYWRHDNTLQFVGRSDYQVKIRGHRIELGEVESCLLTHPKIADCVVAARPDSSGAESLVAWVVASGSARPDVDSVLAHLSASLPEYMLPSAVVYLDALPLTPNRKVDRKALPDPGQMRPELAASYVPPQTELEELLADIWIDLLRVDRVGRLDNYFKLGGHSLSAVQLAFRIREQLGIEVPMRAFFNSPTLKGLAATLERILLEAADEDDLLQAMSDAE
jgi:acyl-CoA synthetase (AMP-forming)/AMP-acid ligase II/acyl carrier protein